MSNLAYGVSARRLTRGPGDTGHSEIKRRWALVSLPPNAVRRSGAALARPELCAGSTPAISIPPLAGWDDTKNAPYSRWLPAAHLGRA